MDGGVRVVIRIELQKVREGDDGGRAANMSDEGMGRKRKTQQ